MPNKFLNHEEASQLAKQLRESNQIIVTTNGSFDILHPAHIRLLEKAKAQGNKLIVLLNSDNSIKRFKGDKRPILPEKDRVAMLSALASVDHVVIFEEDTPLSLIEKIKPHKHVKGGSFLPERIAKEKSLLSQWNGEIWKEIVFNLC